MTHKHWNKDLNSAPYGIWIELCGASHKYGVTGARLPASLTLQDQHGQFYTPDADIGTIIAWREFEVTASVF